MTTTTTCLTCADVATASGLPDPLIWRTLLAYRKLPILLSIFFLLSVTVAGQGTRRASQWLPPSPSSSFSFEKESLSRFFCSYDSQGQVSSLGLLSSLGEAGSHSFSMLLEERPWWCIFHSPHSDFGIPQTYQIAKLSFVTARIHEIMGTNVTK